MTAIITATHFSVLAACISNRELVESYNIYVRAHNSIHPNSPIAEYNDDFIVQASGIK